MDTIILGIESSCDDTSAAVIKNGVLLSQEDSIPNIIVSIFLYLIIYINVSEFQVRYLS
jgi:hypothetical protein